VIPTYNRAGYVIDAVESVLTQTCRDFEIIVVDDGSEDETAQVLEPYLDRIRVVRQSNTGMAGARNRGIREARGEFIGLLDSDDRWEPGLLETVRNTFERHPDAGAAFIAERQMDESGTIHPKIFTKRTPGLFFTPEGMIGKDTGVGSGRPPVVRRSLFESFGFYDEGLRGAWDCDLWIRFSFHVPMLLIPEPLVVRRMHAGNFSSDKLRDAEGWLTILDKVAQAHPSFPKEHPRVYRRTRGKNRLRLGRELLARSATDRSALPRARRALRGAIRDYPLFWRAWLYLVWSVTAPSTYGPWRRAELRTRR
jgi:glycosyltransferase involved in cell wall biosynthesis